MTLGQGGLRGQLADADLRLLRIFRAVVESSGLSAAEARLDMSVSAISMALADLEKRLGMKLCQRGRAGFALTDEGGLVYQSTLKLMASVENFRSEVNSLHQQLRGEFNIGITDNLVTLYRHMRVTNSLAALKRRGPQVVINIRMMPPGEIEQGVLDGQLHVGVIPRIKPLSGLEYRDLYAEESRLYCGRGHPLFHSRAPSVEALRRADAVVPAGKLPLEGAQLLRDMHRAATASDREGVAFLILSGEYIGFLPTHYAERWEQERRMRALRPSRFRYRTDFAAITRRGARPNVVLETYLEELEREENDRPLAL